MGAGHFVITAAALLTVPNPAAATPPQYLGTWFISEGHTAPWVDPAQPATAPSNDRLVGHEVIFAPTRIIGPAPLSCRRAAYAMRLVPSAALFQGGLRDPEKDAARLGFAAGGVPTLDTNCNAMLEYHFTAMGTALFALNNTIYVLRRR